MEHILKYSEWQGGSKIWYCTDTSDFVKGSANWWLPARMLGITPAAFVEKLVKEYGCDHMVYNYENNVLVYGWSNQAKCHKFVLDVNRIARNKKFYIY